MGRLFLIIFSLVSFALPAQAKVSLTFKFSENPEIREGADGNSKIVLSGQKIHAEKENQLTLTVSHVDGSSPKLQLSEGHYIHFIAVKGKGPILHFHPTKGSVPNVWLLNATFPKGGTYDVWVQFVDNGAPKAIFLRILVK
ncbi:MAG: hypothetical protein V4736_00425 [Bdellovibrionota bacterium]